MVLTDRLYLVATVADAGAGIAVVVARPAVSNGRDSRVSSKAKAVALLTMEGGKTSLVSHALTQTSSC